MNQRIDHEVIEVVLKIQIYQYFDPADHKVYLACLESVH